MFYHFGVLVEPGVAGVNVVCVWCGFRYGGRSLPIFVFVFLFKCI